MKHELAKFLKDKGKTLDSATGAFGQYGVIFAVLISDVIRVAEKTETGDLLLTQYVLATGEITTKLTPMPHARATAVIHEVEKMCAEISATNSPWLAWHGYLCTVHAMNHLHFRSVDPYCAGELEGMNNLSIF